MKNREFSFHIPHKVTDKGERPAVNLECSDAKPECPDANREGIDGNRE